MSSNTTAIEISKSTSSAWLNTDGFNQSIFAKQYIKCDGWSTHVSYSLQFADVDDKLSVNPDLIVQEDNARAQALLLPRSP